MKHEKILLADDDAQILEMLSEFLRGLGYAVSAVADGWQAMEALKATEFHLAVLDLKLPGYSGLDLLSYVKANAPRTEVILFTGHGGEGHDAAVVKRIPLSGTIAVVLLALATVALGFFPGVITGWLGSASAFFPWGVI